ncbi:interaptin [Lingula anatina]|uniref:Interaptin n=1 Tax=Lingula anatina TaxID=7574 RepID=A0A1S3JHM6_LINAN|nr:interaptin [Lingula anatina]|eukprot:XP_013409868.1 interaptin [Lingula anatina]
MQEGQFEEMQENLKGQIQTRDSKIVEINEQLENIRGKAGDDLDLLEMNNNMSEGDKNVLLLQINIDFLSKRIETLDSQLTSAHQTVDNLREEEEMCQQILGFPLDEQYSLHSSIRRMMEENSTEKQKLQERISSLKGKLKTLRQEKDSLQIKLQGAELDKEMLKNSIKHMKHKFIDVRFNRPSRESSASSQSNDSLGDKLPELPASSFRLNTLHKSTSAPRLASYATPRIVNVSYAGSTNHGRLKTRHGSLSDTPATLEHSVCVVCRQEYKEADNHDRACRFHLKPYKEFNFEKSKRWQCCFKSAETAAGCSFGKHTSKLTYW